MTMHGPMNVKFGSVNVNSVAAVRKLQKTQHSKVIML